MPSDGWVPGQASFTFLPYWGGGKDAQAPFLDICVRLICQREAMVGRCIPPRPRAMGCNRNRPDINTTTVGGRGGIGGLCVPVVIAPSRRARSGGGLENGHP